jgi:hypothetical protein
MPVNIHNFVAIAVAIFRNPFWEWLLALHFRTGYKKIIVKSCKFSWATVSDEKLQNLLLQKYIHPERVRKIMDIFNAFLSLLTKIKSMLLLISPAYLELVKS